MGFGGFIKSAAKKLGSGIAAGAKWIGHNVKPIVHGISSAVEKAAPYVSGALGAFGQTGLANIATKAGHYAGIARRLTENRPPPQPGRQKMD